MLTKFYDRNNTLANSFFEPFYLFSDLAWSQHSSQSRTRAFYNVDSDESGLTLTVDLPGVKKDDLKIEALDKTITVKSKRGDEESTTSYRISKDYDIDSADAKLENGVLSLRFNKAKTSNSRVIQIK